MGKPHLLPFLKLPIGENSLFSRFENSCAWGGEECRVCGAHFLLGPGVNIYRISVNGRNFEYFGEDPYLTSRLVESFIQGVQSEGVAATIKHFVCNNSEKNRRSANSIVEERTLREIYLPAFQAGIDAGCHALMTSYNQVNGEWMSQNASLVNGLLRRQMKFDGLVMTDWTSTWDGKAIAASGVDLEMPLGEAVASAKSELLGSEMIDRMAGSILKTAIASGLYESVRSGQFTKPEWINKYPDHVALARKVNDEGIVLLKNNGLLPLDPLSPRKILVSGNNSERLELAGGGAAHVPGYDLQSYAQALPGTFSASTVTVAQVPTDEQIVQADVVMLFVGYPEKGNQAEGEKHDRPFALPDDALIRRCAKLNRKTIVCVTCGGGVEMDWLNEVPVVLHAFYGGQTGPLGLMDILSGRVNPSGKLPFTIEMKFEDSPGHDYLAAPPNEKGYTYPLLNKKLAMLFDEKTNEFKTFDIVYREGVFVGYRWYEAKKIEPRFPFGFGLSYTTFSFSDIKAAVERDVIKIGFTLKNTGKRAGEEVAQVYVGETTPSVPRPPQELKSFQKVALEPGESRSISLRIPIKSLSFWDVKSHGWKLSPGNYTIMVGSSSRDISMKASVFIDPNIIL